MTTNASDCCPHCHRPYPSIKEDIARLRTWCRDRGLYVNSRDEVLERVAAQILNKQPSTLRDWRYKDPQRLPSRRAPPGWVYRLSDIVIFDRNFPAGKCGIAF